MEQKSLKSPNFLNSWVPILMLCATLGLAPFVPEPHILGKIRWIAGGAVGMKLMDWGDFLFHGFPWILAVRLGVIQVKNRLKAQAS
jgi:hypothetical protein